MPAEYWHQASLPSRPKRRKQQRMTHEEARWTLGWVLSSGPPEWPYKLWRFNKWRKVLARLARYAGVARSANEPPPRTTLPLVRKRRLLVSSTTDGFANEGATRIASRPVPSLVRLLTTSPSRITVTIATITPGVHLVVSPLIERRRVTWATDYPAVLIGDPLLAVSAGLAAAAAGPQALSSSVLVRCALVSLVVTSSWLFGAWQIRNELRRRVYIRQQAFSPSKLWHQFVVYPTLSTIVPCTVLTATAASVSATSSPIQRAQTGLAWVGVFAWAGLTVDAIRYPRQGHGAFDWLRLRAVTVSPAQRP